MVNQIEKHQKLIFDTHISSPDDTHFLCPAVETYSRSPLFVYSNISN